jgi:GTPase Era involved in 16S rRNA processing
MLTGKAPAVPTFVVVGRVNEGKTSIVSTLVEDDTARISPEPGTTTECKEYIIEGGGRPLVRVVDTPGFQEPERCLAWLKAHAPDVSLREETVISFVDTFRGGREFEDEWRLLEPVVEGGFILYVVDASHPYRRNYEAEMTILRWTGRPVIALLNRTSGAPDTEDEWRRVLAQHFNAVRAFDAHTVGFEDRLGLLRLLRELDERLQAPLRDAIQALAADHERRIEAAAGAIADAVERLVSLRVDRPVSGEMATEAETQALIAHYREELARIESDARREIERIFRHGTLRRNETELDRALLAEDLFSDESYEFFGLSKPQLMVSGAAGGALAGGAVDASAGFLLHGIPTLMGTLTGLAGATYLAVKEPRIPSVFLDTGRKLAIGPSRHPNFPWIVLGRAMHHAHLVLGRAHGCRDALEIRHNEVSVGKGPLTRLGANERKAFGRIFGHIRRHGRLAAEEKAEFRRRIRELLAGEVPEA